MATDVRGEASHPVCAHSWGRHRRQSAVGSRTPSLLLKLIEGEEAASLRDYVRSQRTPALPALDNALKSGNSLVSPDEGGPTP